MTETTSQRSFPVDIAERVERCGVIAVLTIDDSRHAVPVAQALLSGGIHVMELTLRTEAALESLRLVRDASVDMLLGVGTILTLDQVNDTLAAGGQFGVAPGLNRAVVNAAQDAGLPFAPGIATPSELETALTLGCRTVKFFPAEASGGLNYLNSLAAPYSHLGVRYIPLGGVKQNNLADYLASPHIMAVGGSWLAPRDLIQSEQWDEITRRAAAARQVVDQVHNEAKQ